MFLWTFILIEKFIKQYCNGTTNSWVHIVTITLIVDIYFLNNVIIIKTKVLLPQASMTLANVGDPV